MVNCKLSETNVKRNDQYVTIVGQKNLSPGFEPMTFQTLGRRSIYLSYGELCHGERGHNILSSYLTRILHTARISNVDQQCVVKE